MGGGGGLLAGMKLGGITGGTTGLVKGWQDPPNAPWYAELNAGLEDGLVFGPLGPAAGALASSIANTAGALLALAGGGGSAGSGAAITAGTVAGIADATIAASATYLLAKARAEGGDDRAPDHDTAGPGEDHHRLPREFKEFFEERGLDIEDVKRPLDAGAHRKKPGGLHTKSNPGGNYNQVWRDWIESNPNADKEQILKQLEKMENKSGLEPPK